MQLQLASVLAVLALISSSVSAPVAEPIVPAFVAGAAAKFGALSLGKKAAIVGGVAATGAVAHGFTSSDKQRHAKFEWQSPNEKTVWTCGTTVTISANSFGFGSFWRISTSTLTLIDSEGAPLGEIMKQKTYQFLKEERTLGIGRARNGKATFSWDIPQDVASGNYKIEFETRDALNTDRSRYRFTSPTFEIQCGGTGGNNQTSLTDSPNDASNTSDQ